eukprot:CAMPEP_0184493124 /NCGR_PEP_ID=MMETSP0113_2-20130426/25145_1 /TAXON_ID=91329 /ORGANISM="Norrisiella sphaerica, Strain BC52" /LENGTH=339 /DNA_ID=CAMNT_0026878265 /DNA_START=58 /DNA_END=1074 /DNA_ORIENTATION=-
MDMLYFYAMGHQADVDVRWARGNIAELLFKPLILQILEKTNASISVTGNSLVKEILLEKGEVTGIVVEDRETGATRVEHADAFVLAVGVTGLKKIVECSPGLKEWSKELRYAASGLKSLDVISTRIWLDKRVMCPFPSNILADFEELEGAGATFFCLDALQDDPWGQGSGSGRGGGNQSLQRGSVIAADFYGASNLLRLTDEEIVRRISKVMLPSAVPAFKSASVIDSWVKRFPNAVTHFAPGSETVRPPQTLADVPNLFIAGDLVRDLDHGSAGLSQERAYVSGLVAGNKVIERFGGGKFHEVLATEEDEPQFAAAVELAKATTGMMSNSPLRALLPP